MSAKWELMNYVMCLLPVLTLMGAFSVNVMKDTLEMALIAVRYVFLVNDNYTQSN